MALVGFIGLCLLVGAASGAVTRGSIQAWYTSLAKPIGTPPGPVFPAVWAVLYLAMGTAAWLVWREGSTTPVRRHLRIWGWQLLLNALWSPAFFGLHSPPLGLAVIVPLFCCVIWTARSFFKVQRLAGWLMVPYAAWVAYALYLNAGIWWLNR
jgi:tryptophan-rich sensory protein